VFLSLSLSFPPSEKLYFSSRDIVLLVVHVSCRTQLPVTTVDSMNSLCNHASCDLPVCL
jgi:hypothetical protein